ncbi:uncharacterized protein [Macrobrachium rosenbergii]|uniref:uncharacterized protein n=1 Tax=Macrobrachium rosenbergii TaxID=79674 RepID=UPI0034D5AF2A
MLSEVSRDLFAEQGNQDNFSWTWNSSSSFVLPGSPNLHYTRLSLRVVSPCSYQSFGLSPEVYTKPLIHFSPLLSLTRRHRLNLHDGQPLSSLAPARTSQSPRSFIPQLPRSFIPQLPRSPIPQLPRSPIPEIPRSFIPQLPRSFIPQLPRPFTPQFKRSFIPQFKRSFIPQLPRPFIPQPPRFFIPYLPRSFIPHTVELWSSQPEDVGQLEPQKFKGGCVALLP